MTDDVRDIPPALTADEWIERSARIGERAFAASAHITSIGVGQPDSLVLEEHADDSQVWITDTGDLAKLIALANAALHDEDPRKFTWETVDALRRSAKTLASSGHPVLGVEAEHLDDLADVIESYLPPAERE